MQIFHKFTNIYNQPVFKLQTTIVKFYQNHFYFAIKPDSID